MSVLKLSCLEGKLISVCSLLTSIRLLGSLPVSGLCSAIRPNQEPPVDRRKLCLIRVRVQRTFGHITRPSADCCPWTLQIWDKEATNTAALMYSGTSPSRSLHHMPSSKFLWPFVDDPTTRTPTNIRASIRRHQQCVGTWYDHMTSARAPTVTLGRRRHRPTVLERKLVTIGSMTKSDRGLARHRETQRETIHNFFGASGRQVFAYNKSWK